MKLILSLVLVVVTVLAVIFVPIVIGNRPLSVEEKELVQNFFGDSLDEEKIRINEGGVLTWVYPGVTTGNIVSFPKGTYDSNDTKDQALFLHEMVHVWQYQHDGPGYIFRALWEEITQPDAYVVHYDESKSFRDYDVEEQGEIFAEYFLTGDERYMKYIEEIKAEDL